MCSLFSIVATSWAALIDSTAKGSSPLPPRFLRGPPPGGRANRARSPGGMPNGRPGSARLDGDAVDRDRDQPLEGHVGIEVVRAVLQAAEGREAVGVLVGGDGMEE